MKCWKVYKLFLLYLVLITEVIFNQWGMLSQYIHMIFLKYAPLNLFCFNNLLLLGPLHAQHPRYCHSLISPCMFLACSYPRATYTTVMLESRECHGLCSHFRF